MKSRDPWNPIISNLYGEILRPRATYGHPFYKEVPSWIHYSGDQSRYRQLFDGVFVGADTKDAGAPMPNNTAPLPRKGLLADVAPIVAPATGGITVKKEFDSRQILHVEICVDGKCYRTSMDLAPAIDLIMQKLAVWHQSQHAPAPAPTTVVSTIENAIGVAGDAMAETMVGHHVTAMTGGWLSDIGSAVGGTLRKLQPVIATVATGVATAAGGPAAGAAAAKLVPMWTNLQANALDPKGDPKKKAAAQKQIQQINQQAATDPALAAALSVANQAVKHTTVAYHVKDRAQKAAGGDKTAQIDINNLVSAAEKGDPGAKSTFDVLAATFGQQIMQQLTGSAAAQGGAFGGGASFGANVSGWYDVVSG